MTAEKRLPTLSPSARSLVTPIVIVACAAILWAKLDWLGNSMLFHDHPAPQPSTEPAEPLHVHSAMLQEHPHPETSEPGRIEPDGAWPEGGAAHSHGPFDGATHPLGGDLVLLPEWAPCRHVAVALPALQTGDAGLLALLGDLADLLLKRTGVTLIVVAEQNDVAARTRFDEIIAARDLDRRRIRFFEVKSLDSIWIRDYGPLFVWRRDDRNMLVIDAAYRDIRLAVSEGLLGMDPAMRPADDLVPIYFSTLLDLTFVHPGFAVNGGDVYADGQGVLYTSEETLHLNTGDREYLAAAFRDYLGIRHVHYLRPLPGPTVKHVDMVFKLASPTTCLVGQYREPEGTGDLASLRRAAADALNENAEYLEQLGLRVVRVPMPDVEKITKWDYFGRVFSSQDRQKRLEALAQGAQVSPELMREKLMSTYAYTYRSYLNSILIVTAEPAEPEVEEDTPRAQETPRLLIVPRFGETVPRDLERQVEQAYREAYGDPLEIVFVPAETLAHANGSLRCIVCPVPDSPP